MEPIKDKLPYFAEEAYARQRPRGRYHKQYRFTQKQKQQAQQFQVRMLDSVEMQVVSRKGKIKKKTVKQLRNCRALLCVINKNDKVDHTFDIRNLRIKPRSILMEVRYPFLEQRDYAYISEHGDHAIILFSNDKQRDEFISSIKLLYKMYNQVEPYDDEFASAQKLFLQACPYNNTALLEMFQYVAEKIGYKNKDRNLAILQLIQKDDPAKINAVRYPQFKEFLKWAYCTQEMIEIFNMFTHNKVQYMPRKPDVFILSPLMTLQEFMDFLINQQRIFELQAKQKTRYLMKEYGIKHGISPYVFGRYLYSPDNNIFDPQKRKIYQDMSQPMNHYFCYSSHNTYLTGNQLTSLSSIQRFIYDLDKGIRCVQIDAHNDHLYISVTHGFTLTSELRFDHVVRAIARWSDLNINHLPIMLSIEVHLNWRNRQQMVAILLNYLGRKILMIEKSFVSFPTALELRNKVMIQTYEEIKYGLRNDITESIKSAMSKLKSKVEGLGKGGLEAASDEVLVPLPKAVLGKQKMKVTEHQMVQNELPKLHQDQIDFDIIRKWVFEDPMTCMNKITAMYKGKISNLDPHFFEYLNVDWYTVIDKARNNPLELLRYCAKGWCRVYPYGLQFNSSNYNIIPIFEVGAQFVSINTQVRDTYRYIQHAFFSENCCGYVLKPPELRSGSGFCKPLKTVLKLKVIACHNIRRPKTLDEFHYSVRMGFWGSVEDNYECNNIGVVRQVTEIVKTQDVIFNYTNEYTYLMTQPYFAFIFFQIPGFGCVAVPIRCMRNGYRAVQLLDNDFEPIEGSYILVRVQLQAELTRTELAAERIMGYDELKRIQKLEEDRMQYRIAEPDKKAYKMEKPPK